MNRIFTYFFIFAFCVPAAVFAQDVALTQFWTAPLYFNPAETGMSDPYDMRFSANYRTQPPSAFTNPAMTGILSFDVATMQDKLPEGDALGIGFIGFYDRSASGGVKNTTAGFSIAYNHSIDRNHLHHLSLGLQAYIVQKQLDVSRLTNNDFYENGSDVLVFPLAGHVDNNGMGYTDANGGLVYTGEITPRLKVEGGYAYYHLANPQETFLGVSHNVDARETGHISCTYLLSPRVKINVTGLLQTQGNTSTTIGGACASYRINNKTVADDRNIYTRIISVGCWYRSAQAIAPYVGFEAQNFHMAFSYDISTTNVAGTPVYSAYELSLFYTRRHRHESDKERENDYFRGDRSIY